VRNVCVMSVKIALLALWGNQGVCEEVRPDREGGRHWMRGV